MRQSLASRASLFVTHLARDVRGVAAVEFAYLVPVILFMLIGTVEVSRAVSIDRRLGQATAMIADLVGRESTMKAADVNALYGIVGQVMSPFDASSLKVSIVPVKASPNSATNTRVYAATTNRPSLNGGESYGKCVAYPLTAGIVAAGGSVIVVEASYSYVPLFAGSIIGPATWTEKAIASPRNSCVDFDRDNCVSTCF
ncbi:MAG: TadE/TadG family type IV pilus assembly protein [Hyphomicrobium sp.]|jgi:Flp pilus assembly protein TadG